MCWYVDDNKIRHVEPKVVDKSIETIEGKFGKMPQTRGGEHDFLGMNIKFNDKKVKISTKKHIQRATNTFMDDIMRNAASPATSYLFKTREDAKLSEEKSENFHSVVASLLFISRRCRLDIQTWTHTACPSMGRQGKGAGHGQKRLRGGRRGRSSDISDRVPQGGDEGVSSGRVYG